MLFFTNNKTELKYLNSFCDGKLGDCTNRVPVFSLGGGVRVENESVSMETSSRTKVSKKDMSVQRFMLFLEVGSF